jgi:hypothetical protein
MAQSIQPGRFGHSSKPDDAWLANQDNHAKPENGATAIA